MPGYGESTPSQYLRPFANDPYGFFPPTSGGFMPNDPRNFRETQIGAHDGYGFRGLASPLGYWSNERGGFQSPGYGVGRSGGIMRPQFQRATDEPADPNMMSFAQWNRFQQQQAEAQARQQQMMQIQAMQQPDLYWPWNPMGGYGQ